MKKNEKEYFRIIGKHVGHEIKLATTEGNYEDSKIKFGPICKTCGNLVIAELDGILHPSETQAMGYPIYGSRRNFTFPENKKVTDDKIRKEM